MLRGYLLGDMRFQFGDREISDLVNRQCGVLLAFLMIQAGTRFTREQIADALWEHHPPADPLKAVRHEIWALKSALEAAGADPDTYIETTNGTAGFKADAPYWLDVQVLRDCLRSPGHADSPLKIEDLSAALDLYRGDLLPGRYDDWCLYPREALRDGYLTALERLLALHEARQQWNEAIGVGKRILGTDPISETTHRALMRCYYAKGDRALALKQFQVCKEMLAKAFDEPIEPMEETAALNASILDEVMLPRPGRRASLKRLSGAGEPQNGPVSELDAIRRKLRAADEKLNQVIRQISEP